METAPELPGRQASNRSHCPGPLRSVLSAVSVFVGNSRVAKVLGFYVVFFCFPQCGGKEVNLNHKLVMVSSRVSVYHMPFLVTLKQFTFLNMKFMSLKFMSHQMKSPQL